MLPVIYHDIALAALQDEAGHQGRDRTIPLVKHRFYWPGMDGDVEKYMYIKNCPRCIRRKAQGKTTAKLVVVDSTYPMDLICMDFLSLEMSAVGYEHTGYHRPFYQIRSGHPFTKPNGQDHSQTPI